MSPAQAKDHFVIQWQNLQTASPIVVKEPVSVHRQSLFISFLLFIVNVETVAEAWYLKGMVVSFLVSTLGMCCTQHPSNWSNLSSYNQCVARNRVPLCKSLRAFEANGAWMTYNAFTANKLTHTAEKVKDCRPWLQCFLMLLFMGYKEAWKRQVECRLSLVKNKIDINMKWCWRIEICFEIWRNATESWNCKANKTGNFPTLEMHHQGLP